MMRNHSILDFFLTSQKVIRFTRAIYNYELQSFQDCFSSCALRYVDIYINWHMLHILRINKYIIFWRLSSQIWWCQLCVQTSSIIIKLLVWYLTSLGLTPAYDISHNTMVLWVLQIRYLFDLSSVEVFLGSCGSQRH